MANPVVDGDFQIATFAAGTAGLATLKSLGVHNPNPIWRAGVTSVKLGDNSARILGAPVVEWEWGFVDQAERDVLRTYCPGASAAVYIWTPTTEKISGVSNAAQRYLAQMIWPAPDKPETPQAGRRAQFVIVFRQLVGV